MATRLRASPWQTASAAGNSSDGSSKATTATSGTEPAKAEGPPRLSWIAPKEVKIGETFAVELQLTSGTQLRGVPLEVAFPTQLWEVLEVSEGAYFKQDGGTTSFTQTINTDLGRVGAAVLRSDASAATGQASVITLKVKAKAAGTAELRVTSFKPITLGGAPPGVDLPTWTVLVK